MEYKYLMQQVRLFSSSFFSFFFFLLSYSFYIYYYYYYQVVRNLDPNWSPATFAAMNSTDLYQVASQIVFNLPPPRVNVYIGTNQDVIRENVVKFASQILYL